MKESSLADRATSWGDMHIRAPAATARPNRLDAFRAMAKVKGARREPKKTEGSRAANCESEDVTQKETPNKREFRGIQ
jgi:hypothetical protein